MTLNDVLLAMMGSGLAVLGWFARELWDSVKKLNDALDTLRTDVSTFYVRKDDFKEFRLEIIHYLQRIENKLDTKVDK